jgi:hypothetical protein
MSPGQNPSYGRAEPIEYNQTFTGYFIMVRTCAALLLALTCGITAAEKPRILISSDIGGGDPDDYQSLVHYLMYSNEVETEAIISSPPDAPKDGVMQYGRRDSILQVLDAYATDYPRLRDRDSAYPSPAQLRAVSFQGSFSAQPDSVPTPKTLSREERAGYGQIIKAANRKDTRPLWVLVWGSMTDVALAVHEQPSIKQRIRVYSIGSWNTYAGDPLAHGISWRLGQAHELACAVGLRLPPGRCL